MADDETRSARQKALAEKKRRLEEIKARRRAPPTAGGGGGGGGGGDANADIGGKAATGGSGSGGGASLDDYIDELLKTSTPGLTLAPSPDAAAAPTVPAEATNASASSATATATAGVTATSSSATATESTSAARDIAPSPAAANATSSAPASARPKVETFEIAIQTEEDDFPPPSLVDEDERQDQDDNDDNDENDDENVMDGSDNQGNNDTDNSSDAHHPTSPSKTTTATTTAQTAQTAAALPPLLTHQQKSQILASPPFANFLSTASKRVERLLGAADEGLMYGILAGKEWGEGGVDFTADYAGEEGEGENEEYDDDEDDEDECYGEKGRRQRRQRRRQKSKKSPREAHQKGGFFTAKATYECTKWTKGRNVTDIEWCPSHKEWVLASYNAVSKWGAGTTGGGGGREALGIQEALSKFSQVSHDPTTRYLSPKEPSSFSLHQSSSNTATTNTNYNYYASTIPNEGIVAIYNLTMPDRPEHIFCAGCPILHSQFHPTEHPKLIIGGASSGQVLVWDARVGRYPVQRSSTTMGGHDCELVGMKVLGDGGSASSALGGGGSSSSSSSSSMLVTASSDGKVNYWSVSNLRDPVEHVHIPNANLSCLEVLPYGEGVVCGDEKGGLHAIVTSSGNSASASAAVGGGSGGSGTSRKVIKTLHQGGVAGLACGTTSGGWSGDGIGDDADASMEDNVEMGHYGMVTAVATRPTMANSRTGNKETTSSSGLGGGGSSRGFQRGVGGLMVTTGVDWSTKLWAPAYSNAPLLSFLSNSYDYMCDVQWSPVHPSIFATASSNGTLNLWNLATFLDKPISGSEGISIENFPSSTDPTDRRGLNRLQWSADGRRMAVASGDKLHVLGVGEDVWKCKGDEDGRVMHNLTSRGLIDAETV